MNVGETAPVTGVIEYDDASRDAAGWVRVESSNPGVVMVLPLQSPDETSYVKAVAPGTATLQTTIRPPLTLNVRVVP